VSAVHRYFYDTEFIEDGTTIELVSIGVVDEAGREFYAVSTQFDPSRAIPWVRDNVAGGNSVDCTSEGRRHGMSATIAPACSVSGTCQPD